MTSPQKHQILDPLPHVIISHFFHYMLTPYVNRQIVANFFIDEGPYEIILHVFYNQYVTDTN